jgi:hypothetical protein
MTNEHLDDDLIQEYVWNPAGLSQTAYLHITNCEHCKTRATNYKTLFSQVTDLPKPSFQFDLSQVVMNKIAVSDSAPVITPIQADNVQKQIPDKKGLWSIWSLGIISIALFAIILYFLRDYLSDLIYGLSSVITILVIIPMLLIAGFLVYEEYRKYDKQINTLDF